MSQSICDRHNLTVQHYTPVDRTIGSAEARLDLEKIKQQLNEARQSNNLKRPTQNLIIYAEEGTEIKEDPGILHLNPKKLILIGAQLIHGPSLLGCLDENLGSNWEKNKAGKISLHDAEPVGGCFVVQWKVKSLAAALQDVPPRKSIFSLGRYNRIYVI